MELNRLGTSLDVSGIRIALLGDFLVHTLVQELRRHLGVELVVDDPDAVTLSRR